MGDIKKKVRRRTVLTRGAGDDDPVERRADGHVWRGLVAVAVFRWANECTGRVVVVHHERAGLQQVDDAPKEDDDDEGKKEKDADDGRRVDSGAVEQAGHDVDRLKELQRGQQPQDADQPQQPQRPHERALP